MNIYMKVNIKSTTEAGVSINAYFCLNAAQTNIQFVWTCRTRCFYRLYLSNSFADAEDADNPTPEFSIYFSYNTI